MNSPSNRMLVADLADDLAWLETYCRQQTSLAERAGEIRLAAALVRNVVGPFLDGQMPPPLHAAVVGGAGTGKSTVVNFLCGVTEAEANPQAGYTRHPIAFTHAAGSVGWPSQIGFLGPLQILDFKAPSSLDEDVYQIRKLPVAVGDGQLLDHFVVWDNPDMTTWSAGVYVPRLLEVAALADVIVYVASDERYNDAVPTQFLRLLLEVGKPVVVVLTKMKPENADALARHFTDEVLAHLPRGRVTLLTIPHLAHDELANPVVKAAKYRVPLVNQVLVLGDPPAAARRRSVDSTMRYLNATADRLIGVAREDVAALEEWKTLVHDGRRDFEDRYRKEYLTGEKFRRFDEALVRMVELLEFPGAGKVVSSTLWVVRAPYRFLKGAVTKALARPDAPTIPEEEVLDAALTGWLDQLRAEALRKSESHGLWKHVAEGFDSELGAKAREQFKHSFRSFQVGLTDEVERTARAIYEELEKSPTRLIALRSSKLALDVLSIGGVLVAGGINAHDIVWVPLSAAVSQQLIEWLGAAYVETQREQTRHRQQELVGKYVAGPMEDWLTRWPATGGTDFERTQLALTRVPTAIRRLDAAVAQAMKEGR
ncbi:MAG: GTPase [Gemmataceae bacterium]